MKKTLQLLNSFILKPLIILSNFSILLLSIISITNLISGNQIIICCIVLELFSIVLSYFYERIVDHIVFNKPKKKFVEVLSLSETRMQKSRKQLRNGLNIIMTVSIFFLLCFSIMYKSPLKLVVGVCVLIITYIYADYIPTAKANYEYYDSLTLTGKDKPSAYRGLAKIYKDEYHLTHFKRKQYNKGIFEYDPKSKEQNACIKSILYMKADSIKYPTLILSIVTIFFNIVLVVPIIPEYAFKYLLKTPTNDLAITIALLIFNTLFAFVNFREFYKYKNDCRTIKKICDAYLSDPLNAYETCNELLDDSNNANVVIARGIFIYCSNQMDNGMDLNNIPIMYRMLYIHRYDANKPRFIITIILAMVAILALLWDLGIDLLTVFIVLLVIFIFSVIFYFTGLKNIGKRRIVKFIEKL